MAVSTVSTKQCQYTNCKGSVVRTSKPSPLKSRESILVLSFSLLSVLVLSVLVCLAYLHLSALQSDLAQMKSEVQTLMETMEFSDSTEEEYDDNIYTSESDTDDEIEEEKDDDDDDSRYIAEEDIDTQILEDESYSNALHELSIQSSNGGKHGALQHIARLRRDVGDIEIIDSPDKQKHRNKKNRKNKRKRGHKSKSSGNRFQADAVHLIPMDHEERMEEVRKGDVVRVSCGVLKPHGLKVDCEVANFWKLDAESRDTSLVYLVHGVVVIKQPGLYYIYSQLTHHDQLGSWSYGIYNKPKGKSEEHSLAQCPGMEPHYFASDEMNNKVYPVQFQCHTSRAVRLHEGDELSIHNEYFEHANRVIKLSRHLTFWGLVRLAD